MWKNCLYWGENCVYVMARDICKGILLSVVKNPIILYSVVYIILQLCFWSFPGVFSKFLVMIIFLLNCFAQLRISSSCPKNRVIFSYLRFWWYNVRWRIFSLYVNYCNSTLRRLCDFLINLSINQQHTCIYKCFSKNPLLGCVNLALLILSLLTSCNKVIDSADLLQVVATIYYCCVVQVIVNKLWVTILPQVTTLQWCQVTKLMYFVTVLEYYFWEVSV
jgi:hypothetical protein